MYWEGVFVNVYVQSISLKQISISNKQLQNLNVTTMYIEVRFKQTHCDQDIAFLWPFGGFSRGDLSPFRLENTIIRHGTNQPP